MAKNEELILRALSMILYKMAYPGAVQSSELISISEEIDKALPKRPSRYTDW